MRRTYTTEITNLPESEFTVVKPIPVVVEGSDEDGWIASFHAGGQAMSGETYDIAIEELTAYIMDSVESWTMEPVVHAVPIFAKKVKTMLKHVTYKPVEETE